MSELSKNQSRIATASAVKTPLLLFSGGLESTYLLYTLLKNGPVDLLCFDHSYNLPSAGAERTARYRILRALAKRNDIHRVQRIVTLQDRILPNTDLLPFRPTYPQLFEHLVSAIHTADAKRHCAVVLGLALTDDSATIHEKLPSFWQSMFSMFRTYGLETAIPELQLPLKWIRRHEVYRATPRWLLNKTWSCASPNFINGKATACGICVKCIDHKRMLEDIKLNRRQQAQLQQSINQQIDESVERIGR